MVSPKRHTELLAGTLQNLYFPPEQYQYFERARDYPFSSGSPVTKAAWAADASMLAYARRGQRRMTDEELRTEFDRAGLAFQKIGGVPADWNAPGTQAVFAHSNQVAILAFRGTEADDPRDCMYDADILLVHEPDYRPVGHDPMPELLHLSTITQLITAPCLVHRGFQTALNSVWDSVHAAVIGYRQNRPGAEICFTGHSLGGALAVLAYSRFADPDLSLITFGCPRVGNAAFRAHVESNPGRGIYRYVNYNDAVAHIPLEDLLYRHVPSGSFRFDENGNLAPWTGAFLGDVAALQTALTALPNSLQLRDLHNVPAPPSVVDHSPARYCFRLWDCV